MPIPKLCLVCSLCGCCLFGLGQRNPKPLPAPPGALTWVPLVVGPAWSCSVWRWGGLRVHAGRRESCLSSSAPFLACSRGKGSNSPSGGGLGVGVKVQSFLVHGLCLPPLPLTLQLEDPPPYSEKPQALISLLGTVLRGRLTVGLFHQTLPEGLKPAVRKRAS